MQPKEWIYNKEPLLYKAVEIVTPRLSCRIWEEAWKERECLSGTQCWISTLASSVNTHWWKTDEHEMVQGECFQKLPRLQRSHFNGKSQIILAASYTFKASPYLKLQERMHTIYKTTSPVEELPKETRSEAVKRNLTPPVSLQLWNCTKFVRVTLHFQEADSWSINTQLSDQTSLNSFARNMSGAVFGSFICSEPEKNHPSPSSTAAAVNIRVLSWSMDCVFVNHQCGLLPVWNGTSEPDN